MWLNSDFRVKQDPSDWRDRPYSFARLPLRNSVDLRNWASPVENQRHLGSCTGQAVVGAYELLLKKEMPDKYDDLSRLFVYYNARVIEDVVNEDVGAYIRDAIKAVQKYGICKESIWPYIIDNFALPPTIDSYTDAKNRNIKRYYRINKVNDLLDALNKDMPVVFSMEVYKSFGLLYEHTTILPIPEKDEQPIGGHAMCLVGYDLEKRLLLARNSFGPDWCMNGYCWIPFDYAKEEFLDSWIFDIDIKN